MARVADLIEVSPQIQASYDRVQAKYGKLLEPVTVTANHPDIFKAYMNFESSFGVADKVDPALKELAMLKVASIIGCPFCLDIGSAKAGAVGITETQLRSLSNHGASNVFSETEVSVLEYAVAMTRNPVEVSDALFDRLRRSLDTSQIIEITAAIAWENYRSRFNRALGIQSQGFSEQTYCVRPEEGATFEP